MAGFCVPAPPVTANGTLATESSSTVSMNISAFLQQHAARPNHRRRTGLNVVQAADPAPNAR
jgi:hypothetical protein